MSNGKRNTPGKDSPDCGHFSLEEPDHRQKAAVLLAAVDDSARHVRNRYFTFLLFVFYIAVIVIAITGEQLFRETGVRLPLLNVELPLRGFYWVAPWLIWLFHLHMLSQFYLLSRKLFRFRKAVECLPEEERPTQRDLPFPLIFNYRHLGTDYAPALRFGFALAVHTTLVILPLTLLLSIQDSFLAYHDPKLGLNHQIAVTADLALLWFF